MYLGMRNMVWFVLGLRMGLSRLQLFSPCVLFFGSHVSLISKYTVGLHLGMRDMLRCCGLRYTCFV